MYVYISDIRQTVRYRTPVFIQAFPWRLHITITYNLQIKKENKFNFKEVIVSALKSFDTNKII
jgi:hypothetical protein